MRPEAATEDTSAFSLLPTPSHPCTQTHRRAFGNKSGVVRGWAEAARAAFNTGDLGAAMEAVVEARQELRAVLRSSSAEVVRDALFLDLALDDLFRRAVERSGASAELPVGQQMALARLVLENLCLSTVGANSELVLCLLEWNIAEELCRKNAPEWPLRAKAAIERTRLAMSSYADRLTVRTEGQADCMRSWRDRPAGLVVGSYTADRLILRLLGGAVAASFGFCFPLLRCILCPASVAPAPLVSSLRR